MRAICLDQNGIQFHPDHQSPVPLSGEVIIDVIAAGICETDLQLAKGYMGFSGVLGHEFVGIATSGPLAGARVVGEINCNCRKCPRCLSGLGNHCVDRTVVGIHRHDGAFADQVAIPQTSMHIVPDSISDDQAVLIEPLAAALQIQQQIEISSVQNAIVLGDGRLANLCAQAIYQSVKNIKVVGKHELKLARFRKFGIETIHLNDLIREKDFDLVVDCTGSVTGLPLALQLVKPRGTIVMKTTVAADHVISLAPVVIDEISVVGSRCGPFDLAIELLQADRFDLSGLVTHRFALEEAAKAFEMAVDPSAFKVVFDVMNTTAN
ncbi:alcohol dehydrogenase catalytic domain-containing protein [Rhodopirellula sp.]|nr:alcohol dehydrogenase catalytic domain-containing protein [Rhodopirellula sp.]MDB4476953.1 alcohol dehydrogenase catalytic domain-containing protein [Rhodopirellula sp.]